MSDSTWTSADVPDQSGRTAVVTGANSGLGLEATRVLADRGAHVVMACRSVGRGEAARDDLAADGPDGRLSVRELDLADLDSVRAFAGEFGDEVGDLDLLVNNAGVMAIPRRETAEGFEMQLGVNHLGHFALTGLLLPRLRAAGGESRVVTVSSGLHERGDVDFDDLHWEETYDEWGAYARSKLANLLFAYELQRRLEAAGPGAGDVASLAAHPGWAATNLQRRGPEQAGDRLRLLATKAANALVAQPPERGALPILYAATAPGAVGGGYYGPGGFMELRGPPTRVESSARARDPDLARRLWAVSEEQTGVEFDLPAPTA